jgi:FKBP-type peptidyl-prolyl cis-trans isomerase 2
MSKAKNGDMVKVHYVCSLEDGTVINNTREKDPFQFTIGQGQVIPGFEEAVLGMNESEEKTTKVPMEKAFGPYKEKDIVVVERENFSEDIKLEVGKQLQITSKDGKTIICHIVDVAETYVALDTNHPLSGKNLIFDIQLLEIT